MNDYNFKPFQQVLVRDSEEKQWSCSFYSHYNTTYMVHICANGRDFKYCIPYEGNEHLLGTTDSPKPKRWRAEKNGEYWYVNPMLQVDKCHDTYYDDDDKCYNIGNYFRTREEAEEIADRFKEMLKGE